MKRVEASSSKPRYLIAEIFIDAQRAGGQQQAIDGAKQLIDQLQKGAPFAAVARQFSAAATGPSGGDAGWQAAEDLQPPLARALEELKAGQLSEPIPVNGGAYILLLRDRQAGNNTIMVDLKQAAIKLDATADEAQLAAARTKLEALRGQIKSCSDLEAATAKVEGVVAGDLGEADLNDLAPAFRDAVKPLQVGQVSPPVRTSAGLHLVALCGRKAGGAQAVDKEDLENRLYEQELSMIARRELRNLRNSASIENR
jgi:peptidyl-prolyl cis-trans isomerase SurA